MADNLEKNYLVMEESRLRHRSTGATAPDDLIEQVQNDLNITGDDLANAQKAANELSLEETRDILRDVIRNHENDQNFPIDVLEAMEEFIENERILTHPQDYEALIAEMKVEAALIKNDSPYPEVRAVVGNTDDPTMPCSTIRAWTLGMIYVAAGVLINQLFYIRQPPITLEANVAQLLAYPAGKAWEKWMPGWQITLFGKRHSLNPGKFNQKEHMLITIMANVGFVTPYSTDVIMTQFLPQYFNQQYASHFGYQILLTLGTNFIGYGVAGLTRHFLVYPAHCVWPSNLVTIALNQSFHCDLNVPVPGPIRRIFTTSRYKCFTVACFGMFVYYWFPNYIFQALSYFSWIVWIAPNNVNLATICGMQNGMGVNPISTFDWNILCFDQGQSPLVMPFFFWWNTLTGMVIGIFVILAFWYKNIYNTGYLSINSPRVFDHFGEEYNVSRAIDYRGFFDAAKYESYSPPFLAAGNLVSYLSFFALYTAILTWTGLYHRYELWRGLKNLFRRGRRKDIYPDVHNRLMSKYPEVSELWYLAVLIASIACSLGAILGWPTYTSPAVIIYGIVLCLIFIVPIGIVNAISGMEVTLNVLAEFIGGAFSQGNALSVNYFKAFGYITSAHALHFTKDLKLAHYLKIPPRHTFAGQMVATLVATFVATSMMNYQMTQIPDICSADQKDHYTCPSISQYFTAAVLWGTVGTKKVFGSGGMYTWLLIGFPLGVLIPVTVYLLRKYMPRQRWLRNVHPPAMCYGSIYFAPYNISYLWPGVVVAYISQVYVKKRYIAFWAKYNYVLSAAFSSGVAIAAIVIFFALQMQRISIDWWGNNVIAQGCEDTPCTRLTLADGEYFGPRMGEFH